MEDFEQFQKAKRERYVDVIGMLEAAINEARNRLTFKKYEAADEALAGAQEQIKKMLPHHQVGSLNIRPMAPIAAPQKRDR